MSSRAGGLADTRPLVLIVDDEPLLRLLSREAVEALGFAAEEAEDGQQALDRLETLQPDLMLLDVDMPVLDGFATCRALRARGYEMPVLIATALSDPHAIERAFEAGATDFISKPLDWNILRHRLRFLLRASSAFSNLRQTLSELQDSRVRLATAHRLASIGHWEWMPEESRMSWSEELYRMLGIEPGAEVASVEALLARTHEDDRSIVEKSLQRSATEGEGWALDHRLVTSGGDVLVVHQEVTVERGGSAGVERVSGVVQDITARRRAEEQIRNLALYDPLTSLPNRNSLKHYLERLIDRARRRSEMTALLFFDLDRFKRINDTLGHVSGDDLLKAVAQRLLETVRTTDYIGRPNEVAAPVSRLGGDEFAVVLNNVGSLTEASQAAIRILEALGRPFRLNDQEIVMGACIGISMFPADAPDADTLLRHADTALHQAKRVGGNCYRFFDESSNQRAVRNLQLESGLRRAIESGELRLHYQPLKGVRTQRIIGVEALVRWQSPEFGMLSPIEFIPLAEETGLIELLGRWVLGRACAQLRLWQRSGIPLLRTSVNVSSRQLRTTGIVNVVEEALAESGLEPHRLELELTESAIIGDEPNVMEVLRRLKGIGVGLALDDFGTGYSSLTHLIRFPIDRIKIDRSFVSRIGLDPQSDAIVAALVAMAHRLGLSVTAEGVETVAQAHFLQAEDCDILQGYLIARPSRPETLAEMLRSHREGDV